jgi:hypothetical protein
VSQPDEPPEWLKLRARANHFGETARSLKARTQEERRKAIQFMREADLALLRDTYRTMFGEEL